MSTLAPRAIALAALLLLAMPAASMAAATVSWSVGLSTLTVTDEAGQATTFDLSYLVNGAGTADNVVRIEASGGIGADVSAAGICNQVDPDTLDCDHYPTGPVFDLFDLRAGDANDTINTDLNTMHPANLDTTAVDLYGQDGDDVINGTARGDIIYGGAGNDDVYANDGADVLYGGEGGDELFGGDGADSLNGEGGSDRLSPGIDGDVDLLNGGETDENPLLAGDLVTLVSAPGPGGVSVTLADGLANDGPDLEDYDSTIESVEGSLFDDTITLGADAGTAYGSDGDDALTGGGGNDTLWGEDGDDVLAGAGGTDSLRGGEGAETAGDTVTYAASPGPVTVTMGAGDGNDGAAGEAETIDSTIENLTGSAFADTITGDSSPNALRGEGGDDTIDARGSDVDTLVDCGAGAADVARTDTVAAGGVDDPAPVACESINPVDPPDPVIPDPDPQDPDPPLADPIATRLAGSSARIVRARCTRAQRATGVRDGDRRWCYRLVVRTTLRRVDVGATVAGQRINVLRVVGRRQVLVQSATTNARGIASVRRVVVVPPRHRASLAAANRWLAAQYRTTRLRHAASGDYAAARTTTIGTRR